jgi:hypothetical protein
MFIEILGKGSRRSKRIDLKLRASADRKPGMALKSGDEQIAGVQKHPYMGVRLERAGIFCEDEAIKRKRVRVKTNMVKRIRAYGGCLGVARRRRP